MPFSKAHTPTGHLNEKELDYIYEKMIKVAVSEYMENGQNVFNDVSRYNSQIGSIVAGITSSLNTADLVIADLTGLNPNVMYELGVRHTLKRGTIIISQDINSIPSDLRDYMCVGYNFSKDVIEQEENHKKFQINLHNTIHELFTTEKFDSPVLSYLRGKEIYWREDEIKELKSSIIVISYILEQYDSIQELLKNIHIVGPKITLKKLSPLLTKMQNGMSDLRISVESAVLYDNIQAATSLLGDVIKRLFYSDYFQHLGEITNSADEDFERIINGIFQIKFHNYFYLDEKDPEQLTLLDIFDSEKDFYAWFFEELEEFMEKRAKELGIGSDEIDFMLTH